MASDNALLARMISDGVPIPARSYVVDGPVTINGDRPVVFQPGTVIVPSVVWTPQDSVLVVTGKGIQIRGDLTIDERGYLRTLYNSIGVTAMLTNVDGADLEQLTLTFQNTGVATAQATIEPVRRELELAYGLSLDAMFNPAAGPSGPDLLLVALDNLDDFYATNIYRAKIGPCRDVRLGRVVCQRGSDTKRSFAVRFASNFTLERSYDATTYRCEEIRFGEIDVTGDYEWNTVEVLGTASRAIRGSVVRQRGKTLCTMDFDKGCSRCHVELVETIDGGKPSRYVGDSATRFSVAAIHGETDTCITADCSFGTVRGRNLSSADTDPYTAGFLTSRATNVVVGEVDIDGLNSGLYGAVVQIDRNVDRVEVGKVRGRNINAGVVYNSTVAIGDVWIGDLDVEITTGTGISATCTGASGRLRVDGGRLHATGAYALNVPLVALDSELSHAAIGDLRITAVSTNPIGVSTNCPTLLRGTFLGALNRGVSASGAAARVRCVGVDAAAATTKTVATAGAVIVGAGNSWDDPP